MKKIAALVETTRDRAAATVKSGSTVAAFPSTYFYAHFRISHKKTLDGNGKMRINSKNAHKKLLRTFE